MHLLKYYGCVLALALGLSAHANIVGIVNAKATKSDDSWTIAVTLNHADVDVKHYADMWRIVTEDGTVLATRELGHPHKDQPFTRDLKEVKFPEAVSTVYIEAHDNVHGWTKEPFKVNLDASLQIGDMVPTFKAVDQDGKPWSLQGHLGGKHLVIYFYPAAMTGGCTKQACSYRDHVTTTKNLAFEIVGISGDTPKNLKYFQQAEGLNFTLLSDPNGDIAKAFGVPIQTGEKTITRTVDGKEVELSRTSTASRWTFIIDPSGKIVYRDGQVNATQDLINVLTYMKQSGN